MPDLHRLPPDPILFGKVFWPSVNFYDRQRETIYSAVNNDETYCVAGNELGKDFVSGFLAVYFLLSRHPARVVTTSAKEQHLRVLWGEIMQFIDTSSLPSNRDVKGVLRAKRGGPLICNHQDLRKMWEGEVCSKSYCLGMVASQESQAAMGGHHIADIGDGIPRTLFIGDESSSIPHYYKRMVDPWAMRQLYIGNAWPCDNFFKRAVKGDPTTGDPGGDVRRPYGRGGFYRRIIRIRAEDSPNVRYALAEVQQGRQPSGRMLVPGVKSYEKYTKHRKFWDKHQQCVGLDADWYEGAEIKLFPADWLTRAEAIALAMSGRKRTARAIGIDPGEGGDRTAMAAVDELGVIEIVSRRTPDTTAVVDEAIAFMKKHNVPPEKVLFDRGGGGKQHADIMRRKGYKVRTVAFGESLQLELKRGTHPLEARKELKEEAYYYVNRRAQMYGDLSTLLDPALGGVSGQGFAIPVACGADPKEETRQGVRGQLAPIPRWYDEEGRLYLPKKNRKPGEEVNEKKPTLIELIGHSPDEADALVLAVHGMLHKPKRPVAGVVVVEDTKR